MEFFEVRARENGSVSLSKERWNHIVGRHPEMSDYLDSVEGILSNPDIIVESSNDGSVWVYHKSEGNIYIVVVTNVSEEFVLTAYKTDDVKNGRIIWEKD